MDKIMEFWYSKDEEMIKKYKYLIMLGLTSEYLDELRGDDEKVGKYKKKFDEVTVSIGINDWIDEETDQRMIRNTIKREALKKGHKEALEQGKENKAREIVINLFNYGMKLEDIARNTSMPYENAKNIINSIKMED